MLNQKQLAAAMGVNPSYVTAMKRAGYRFLYGHQTTLEHALRWRQAFPDFVAKHYLAKGAHSRLPKLTLENEHPAVLNGGRWR